MHSNTDTLSAVPITARSLTIWGTLALWIAANLVVPTIMTGQMFVPDLNPYSAISAVFWGSAFGCIAIVAVAIMGTRTGMPTLALFIPSFGRAGARFPATIDTIILTGWSLIQAYLGAISFNYITTALFGLDNIILSIVIVQGFVWGVTIMGHTKIEMLQKGASVAMLIFALIVFYVMFRDYGQAPLSTLPVSKNPAITFAIAFDVVVATAFSWLTVVATFNRYCKSEFISAVGVSVGYLLGTLIAMGLGIIVASLALLNGLESTYDPTVLLSESGYGVVAALVLLLSVVTTNIMALYAAVMSAMVALPNGKFIPTTLVLGTVTVLGAMLQDVLLANFFNWVLLVGTLFIPVFAIAITDFYFVKKQKYDVEKMLNDDSIYNGVRPIAFVSWILGAGASYYFVYIAPLSTGVTVFAAIGTGVLYYLLSKITKADITKTD